MAINFFQEEINYNLPQKNLTKRWLRDIAKQEGYHIADLNYIFCTDEYLYQINVDYLNHNTYTDIISFDNSETEDTIEGDIFISIERIKDNAKSQQQDTYKETIRVISHGLLHLCGYKDKTTDEVMVMRQKENDAIALFFSLKEG